jgi:hypothetical protein
MYFVKMSLNFSVPFSFILSNTTLFICFMKQITLFAFTFLLCFNGIGQVYWQQEVNYKIDVTLDDVKHEITAFEEFEYINNSPSSLDFIYIHLWPNAYRNEKTALGKQQWKGGETILKYGADSLKGGIDNLDFKVNGQTVKWEYDVKNVDICKLFLATPLAAGARLTVSTPFKVKIPSGEISRLGHVGQSYQITQWYPKPAVYDKNGWNQIPYLNQGEFYSEFGSFDVRITLPKNYVVGATGDLQTATEIDFLNALAAQTQEKFKNGAFSDSKNSGKSKQPASDLEMKTLRYTQSKVHDFAWFADKSFEVLKGEVVLPDSKRKVTTWAMFTPRNAKQWEQSIEYINDATYYYSLWNGDYPYSHVTAVDGTISAGGGMEYPNVTVIGNTSSKEELEVVIVHEVGHNWFYGILGTNERVHGWMDEGMNTLNEVRYMQTKYPDNTRMSDMVAGGKFHMNDLDHHDMGDISYRLIAMMGEDQPVETSSDDFTSTNYGIIMYQKTGLIFFYLRAYLGEVEFGKCMHAYYDLWKFKHPQPEDMRAIVEKTSGKNLSWLFDDLIKTTNHLDYKITNVRKADAGYDVTVKNSGQVNGPIEVNALVKGKLVETVWVDPSDSKQIAHLKSDSVDQVVIDINNNIPEMDRTNNTWKRSSILGKIEPLKLEFLIGDHEKGKSNVFWTPIVAGNYYDKTMLGVVVHNYGIPFNKVQYLFAPMYSFGRESISGMGEMSYSILPKKNVKLLRIGVSLKSFKNDDNTVYSKSSSYFANASPYIFMNLGSRKAASSFSQNILLQTLFNTVQLGEENTQENGAFLKYTGKYTKPDHKVELILRTDYLKAQDSAEELGRISAEATYGFRYLKNNMDRWVEVRAYFGSNYLYKEVGYVSGRYNLSMNGTSGAQDLFYEEYYFGRSNQGGIWGNQRNADMGGFKSANNFGLTSYWMATGNFYMQLPIKPNVFGVFVDGGLVSLDGVKIVTSMTTGLGVRFGKVFGVYFPLFQSLNMGDLFADYSKNIRFSLKMNIVNKGLKIPGIN